MTGRTPNGPQGLDATPNIICSEFDPIATANPATSARSALKNATCNVKIGDDKMVNNFMQTPPILGLDAPNIVNEDFPLRSKKDSAKNSPAVSPDGRVFGLAASQNKLPR